MYIPVKLLLFKNLLLKPRKNMVGGVQSQPRILNAPGRIEALEVEKEKRAKKCKASAPNKNNSLATKDEDVM